MSEKTEEAYQSLLEKIDEKCQVFLSKIFEPGFIISDYETGFIAAVKKLMPQVDQLGCNFHYTQAVFRKNQIFGLIIAYRNNGPFQLGFSQNFQPRIFINRPGDYKFWQFKSIWYMPKTEDFLPKNRNFVNYVKKTWIQKTGVFMWNVYDRPQNLGTTNAW